MSKRIKSDELYPGINALTDTLFALPLETIRHFTLLREVEAKSTLTSLTLTSQIRDFLALPLSDPKRQDALVEVNKMISELLPCWEEKIHVAGTAAEAVERCVERLDEAFDRIVAAEIPRAVIFGPDTHPAFLGVNGQAAAPAAAERQTGTRSESRREAAAKKAAAAAEEEAATKDGKRKPPPAAARRDRVEPKTEPPVAKRRKATAKDLPPAPAPVHGYPSPARPVTPSAARRGGRTAVARGSSRRPPPDGNTAVSPPRDDTDNEPVYCYCQQVSYGEMVACDGPDCKREWFHLPCVGLSAPPKGQWYCEECAAKYKRR
ncbi:uncharacterized protein V1510DRAFT_371401, partial [Dipodascopsis tothii]|uniref:uncharacterized protein n=1 Tax=Dipodascopsis tothii TaxID=44089 RepID=UPI0034CE94ED